MARWNPLLEGGLRLAEEVGEILRTETRSNLAGHALELARGARAEKSLLELSGKADASLVAKIGDSLLPFVRKWTSENSSLGSTKLKLLRQADLLSRHATSLLPSGEELQEAMLRGEEGWRGFFAPSAEQRERSLYEALKSQTGIFRLLPNDAVSRTRQQVYLERFEIVQRNQIRFAAKMHEFEIGVQEPLDSVFKGYKLPSPKFVVANVGELADSTGGNYSPVSGIMRMHPTLVYSNSPASIVELLGHESVHHKLGVANIRVLMDKLGLGKIKQVTPDQIESVQQLWMKESGYGRISPDFLASISRTRNGVPLSPEAAKTAWKTLKSLGRWNRKVAAEYTQSGERLVEFHKGLSNMVGESLDKQLDLLSVDHIYIQRRRIFGSDSLPTSVLDLIARRKAGAVSEEAGISELEKIYAARETELRQQSDAADKAYRQLDHEQMAYATGRQILIDTIDVEAEVAKLFREGKWK